MAQTLTPGIESSSPHIFVSLFVSYALNSGTRPLHWAAHRGLVAIAKMLLDKRADVNSKDNGYGHHPKQLQYA